MWWLLLLFLSTFTTSMLLRPRPMRPQPPSIEPEDDLFERLLQEAEHQDRVLFAQDPTAFWNDPHRYGGLRLEEWEAQQRRASGLEAEPIPVVYGEPRVFANVISFGGHTYVDGARKPK